MEYLGGSNDARESGILMPFRALPGDHDYRGTYGEAADDFLLFAAEANFSNVHDLPFSPPDPFDSPYSSDSAFAIDQQRIDLNHLAQLGDIESSDLDDYQRLAQSGDFGPAMRDMKEALLKQASINFANSGMPRRHEEFNQWREQEAWWLDAYAAYDILKEHPDNTKNDNWRWQHWEVGKDYSKKVVDDVRIDFPEDFYAVSYGQWIVEQQAKQYLAKAKELGVGVWGDVPFYAGHGEVWAHRNLFNLDEDGFQINQGGADKSVTSETGQMWGFATYKVDNLENPEQINALVDWWVDRIVRAYELSYGQVRFDHFIGWAEPYIIAADAENGLGGYRDKGIGRYILAALHERFGRNAHFYPEDLGTQTEATPALRDEFGLFANTLAVRGFTKCLKNGDYPNSIHNPDNYRVNSVSMSTNHDMATLIATMDKIRTESPGAFDDYLAYENQKNYLANLQRSTSSQKLARHVMERIMYSDSTHAFMWIGDVLQAGQDWQYNIPNTVLPSNWSKRMNSDDMRFLYAQAEYWRGLNERSGRALGALAAAAAD